MSSFVPRRSYGALMAGWLLTPSALVDAASIYQTGQPRPPAIFHFNLRVPIRWGERRLLITNAIWFANFTKPKAA